MNNTYKELNIQKSLYRGCGESFAERLEKMDPTENYRGTELGSLDAFQRQLKRFDIQVGGSHSSALEKFFQNGQSAVLFPEYLMRAIRQGMEENDPLSSIVAARTLISATDYRGLTTNDDLEADVTNEAAALSTTTISLKDKTTADPQPTLDDVKEKFEQAIGQGSDTEMLIHEFCDKLQIPFEKISSEDFSAFLRILSLSKQLKSPNNMRGKASPIPPNRKARRKRK